MLNNLHSPNTIVQDSQPTELAEDISSIQRIKNEVAFQLLEEWLADESGYDEQVWDSVKKSIEENRLSERRKFDD
jgi:hypothetical protein